MLKKAVKSGRKFEDRGHYQKDAESPHIIVTQGVHTWMMPMRVGTNNEIVSVIVK